MRKSALLISHEMSRNGAPIMLLQAARTLISEGFRVNAITYKDGPLKEEFQSLGISVTVEENIFEMSEALLAYGKEHDIVIINTIVCSGAVKTFLNQDIPVLWWIHEGMTFIPAIKGTIPDVLSKNFYIYCVSEYTRRLLSTLGDSYSAHILYNGIDGVKDGYNLAKSEYKTRFMCIGTIETRKGQDLIVKAIEEVVKKGVDDIEYVFVGAIGESPIKKQLDDVCTKYSFVKYYPIMPREEVLGMLSGATALLVPSRDDPSPLVASEAMMLGVPVIVSDRTGTAALIASGTNGFVIENENYMELAEKILWLVNNPEEARRIGTKGRKIYEQYYSMERFNSEYVAIVNKIVYLFKLKRPLKSFRRWISGKLHSLYRCI